MDSQKGQLEKAFKIARKLLRESRQLGAVSVTYHYAVEFSTAASERPYMHFSHGSRYTRQALCPNQAAILRRLYDFLIRSGDPIVLSEALPKLRRSRPEETEAVWSLTKKIGIFDAYMVPVYCPYRVNGVVAFGFPKTVEDAEPARLYKLEQLAAFCHYQFVRNFKQRVEKNDLSEREKEVLSWIALGKSNAEISIIIDISESSVDTYTRRIFSKLGVHDRVSAAIGGVINGEVKIP